MKQYLTSCTVDIIFFPESYNKSFPKDVEGNTMKTPAEIQLRSMNDHMVPELLVLK